MKSCIGKIGFKEFVNNTSVKDIFPDFIGNEKIIDILQDDFYLADTIYDFGEACFKAGIFYLKNKAT